MTELAKKLFDSAKTAQVAATRVAPGLKDLGSDVKAELSRLGTQGSMELASALFAGQAFVPYGPGQYTPSTIPGQDQGQQGLGSEPSLQGERSRGMER
jgi:hypothetical protein